jgi:hypothetical protein
MIAAIVWAGCGGGGEDSLTKAEFTRKANTICAKWQQARGARYSAAQSKYVPLNSRENKKKAIIFVLSPYEAAIDGVGELSPPSGEEETVETLVNTMEEAMAQVKKEPLIATKKPVFEKSNKLVESYGLDECTV